MMNMHASGHEEPVPGLHFNISDDQRQRLWWLLPCFIIIFLIFFARLIQINVLPGEQLAAEDDYHKGAWFLEYPRGEIFDRNAIVLATNREVPSLYVDPSSIKDDMALVNYLSVRLKMSEEEIMPCLARTSSEGKERKMFPIRRWITDISEAELEEIVSPYKRVLYIKHESLRSYPHNEVAAHMLGFVKRTGEASEGLERTYDDHLRSHRGEILARKDRYKQLLPSELLSYKEPEGGEMVQLTIDCNIQNTLEIELDKRMEEVGAKAAMGMLMNPHTGEVYALASRPAFDPNLYDKSTAELRKNRALLDVFEPGSSFKIVTASAALEHGLVTPDMLIDCENGAFNPYGHLIRDFHPNGVIPFYRAFEESSNIAMIKLGAKLGPERLEYWIRLFGFGATTSPDFKVESRGLFRGRDKWSRLTMGSLPMGQEVAVTIPQLTRAFAVIANGGYVVEPYFVEKAESKYGDVTYQHQSPPIKRILSPETAATMKDLCHRVVLNGTGKTASIPEYRVGGKTGTAQMARKGGGGYDPDRYTAIFAGFAPVADPRIVGVIVIQEPSIREHWGGSVCGPVFQKVVRDALIRLNVPEDPVIDPKKGPQTEESPLLARMTRTTEEQLLNQDPLPEVNESGEDADTATPPVQPEDLDRDLGKLISPLEKLALLPGRRIDENSERALPDLTGMSKSQARECLQRLGVVMDAQGAGWVTAQDVPPGTVVEQGAICALQFADKSTGSVPNDAG